MKRTEVSFDIHTVPAAVRQHIEGAVMYDSSCSELARTYLAMGAERTFLKIGAKGALERESAMMRFLNGHKIAPKVIAYETDSANDYLLTEAVPGEDGTEAIHLENPAKLAAVFGESLRMLHTLPAKGCPYPDRTAEMIEDIKRKRDSADILFESGYQPKDDVIIHGDYCLPNIIMDRYAFKGFIDVGFGGIGDKHYDLYWGLWTLLYNVKTDRYHDIFLDAYGRQDVDAEGLDYFTKLVQLSD